MSLEIPKVAVAFGSVTPPQGDVIELRVHLGCTKEVSSFSCLLQNFDKKYTVTNPINVGDNCHFDIGRGDNVPLILTGRVEEVEPESTPVENYIRVRGRCWGEKIFRRVVTKTYENQKGEAVVRDLIDNFVGLSHTRTKSDLTSDASSGQKDVVVADASIFSVGDLVKVEDDNAWEYNEVSAVDTGTNTVTMVNNLANTYAVTANGKVWIDLIEKTDTTYTLLEYKDAKVFDILKYIAESADKSGVIGFDFRVEYDGKFAFFPKNSKTSPISLSEKIEHSRYSKDIHRVRNKIMVHGAPEKPYPLDVDGSSWSDSLTEELTKPDNYLQHADGKWEPSSPSNVYIETSTVHTGSKSVKVQCGSYVYDMVVWFIFDSDKYVNCSRYPKLCFTLRLDSNHHKKVGIQLEDKDGNVCRQTHDVSEYDEWQTYELGVGKHNQESWTMSVFNSGPFDWENLKKVTFDFPQLSSKHGVAFIDRMHFGGCRWEDTEEDSSSQSSYGLRELVEVDEELHSDHECELRAKALLDHLSQPAEFLTLRTTCLDYGTDRLLPGDTLQVTLPNENIDSDFRIISVEYLVSARDQTLEITLELGKEKPLLADYLYGLRSTTITVEKLMRTKAGLTGGIIGGGGGGGGGGMVQHGNEWHDPDFSQTGHTHVEADITDLDHDAQKIKGKTVDDSAIGDGKVLVYRATPDALQYETVGGGGGADEKVKVSTDDTTTDFLLAKLLAGTGVTLTEKNPGANEKVEIKAHRAWNWADEQSWDRYVALPLTGKKAQDGVDHGQGGWKKYGQVLGLGASGKFDDKHVILPVVLRVGDEYFMYYTGQRDSDNKQQIGLAIRSNVDPKGSFTRHSTDPIISAGSEGTYDTDGAASFSVIYDREANKFIGWYRGKTAAGNIHMIKCESNDGKSWSGFTKVYDLASNDSWFFVIRVGRCFYCAFHHGDTSSVYLLTSNDGVNWEEYGEIIPRGSSGEWDAALVNYCTIFWNLGVWYAFYCGRDSAGKRRNGMALSSNGMSYTKWMKNPVLALGAAGDFDDERVVSPTGLLCIEDGYYLWYCGHNGSNYTIGLAYMPHT